MKKYEVWIMTIENSSPEEEFPWATFMNDLPAYVRLEFAGQSPEDIYPEWAFHIATSVECQAAYYEELRKQSLAQAVANANVVEPSKAASVLRQLRNASVPTAPTPSPSWAERVIEHGRAWIEAETAKWRQLQITFRGLQSGATVAPALAGMMSSASTAAKLPPDTLYVAPADSGFEVAIAVLPQVGSGDKTTCQVEVMLTLYEQFGDYSGIDLLLQWDDASRQATTDRMGRAVFTELPYDQVKAMNLTVLLPG
jgi:hypothetical protein